MTYYLISGQRKRGESDYTGVVVGAANRDCVVDGEVAEALGVAEARVRKLRSGWLELDRRSPCELPTTSGMLPEFGYLEFFPRQRSGSELLFVDSRRSRGQAAVEAVVEKELEAKGKARRVNLFCDFSGDP